jgi:hypothetical protein
MKFTLKVCAYKVSFNPLIDSGLKTTPLGKVSGVTKLLTSTNRAEKQTGIKISRMV